MLKKTIKETRNQWDLAASHGNYREYIAQGYHRDEEQFRSSGRQSVELLKRRLDGHGISLRGKRILEIGCGAGRMTEFLAKEADFVCATDISIVMLNRFVKRLGNLSNVLLVRAGDLVDFGDSQFDLILSDLVFQHNNEDVVVDYLSEGKRVLGSKGYFVFQLSLRKTHLFVKNPEGIEAVDMTYWTRQEVLGLAKNFNYQVVGKITKRNYKIFQK